MNIKTRAKKILDRAGRLASPVLAQWRRAVSWWRAQSRRYGLPWRAGNVLAALLILASIVTPVLSQISKGSQYKLTATTLSMVGLTDPTLTSQLTYDGQTQTYQFNKGAVQTSDNPLSKLQAQVGTASGKGNDKSLYALDVPQNLSQGVIYHDVNSQLSFSLVPEFSASEGQEEHGHIVFPLGGGTQAIYTLKNNGLKEDIVVPKAATDSMTFSYTMKLPKTLEAKVIPNSNGELGIYSADPTLFGNISYGDSSDQAAVEKAREKSPKTYLVFGLPAPVVKTASGEASEASARFQLSGTRLSVIASGLSSLKGPFTIDPSVVISSASDFQAGNDEGNIDFSTSGQITRGGLTGGTVSNGWQATSNLQTGVANTSTSSYNGYIYTVGGRTAVNGGSFAAITTVQYAHINADGTLGAWQTTTPLPYTNDAESTVAYNGYLYSMGGFYGGSGGGASDAVIYAPIHTDGTIGSWNPTTSLPDTLVGFALTTYNGYAYIAGGGNPSAGSCNTNPTYCTAAVYYAPLNADGSVGVWQTTTSLPFARDNNTTVAYNGYIYVLQGEHSGISFTNEVDYAPINADGSVGNWEVTTSFTAARYGGGVVAYNGYLYLMGGWGAGGSPFLKDTQYAQINAKGTLGTWQYSTNSNMDRNYATAVAYNGYLYLMGGWDDNKTTSTLDVEYAKIDPAGIESGWQTTTSVPTTPISGKTYGVYGQTTIAYNGYLYDIGGSPIGGGSPTPTAAVYYASINADGTIGSWTPTTSLPAARFYQAGTISNGRIYLVGGWSAATSGSTNDVLYININGDGTLGSSWASNTNKFTNARASLSATTYNGYLYVLGGYQGATEYKDVQYAQINSSTGAVGTFTSAASFATGRDSLYTGVMGGYLYVLGGWNGGTIYKDVQFAKLLPGGGLVGGLGSCPAGGTLTNATWCTTSSMQTARYGPTGYIYNGCIYAVGGMSSSQSNTTEYACANSDGTLGSWQSGTSFSSGRFYAGGDIYNGVMYLVGGANSSGPSYFDVQYASINNGGSGTAGSWSNPNAGTSFTTARIFSSSVAYNGYLYVMGGQNGSGNQLNDVQYAPINADGTLGIWQYTYNSGSSSSQVGGFTTARQLSGAVAYNGYMYILGGENSSDLNDVQYAPINADGTLGVWQYTYNSGSSSSQVGGFTTARFGLGAAAHNGYMYILGGDGDLTNAQYAPINADGTLGTWANTSSLTTGRSDFGAVVYGGYMYAIGGYNTGNSIASVEYAPINADGTLGAWQAASSLPVARNYITAVAYDGYMYIMGGYDNGTLLSDTQYAPINADGTLGAWLTTTSLPSANFGYGAAVYNGNIYTAGGQISTDVQYTPLDSIARVGHYSKLVDLGTTMNISSVTPEGTLPPGSTVTYRAAGTNGSFGTASLAASITGTGGCSGNTQYTRYLLIDVSLDDSQAAAFPDAAGTPANLTQLSINYHPVHPAPNLRLRMGQTLQQGALSPFDTCFGGLAPQIIGQASTATDGYSSQYSPALTTSSSTKAGDLVVIAGYVEPANEKTNPTASTYGTITVPAGVTLLPGFPINTDDSQMTTGYTHRLYVWYYYATANGSQTLTFTDNQQVYWGLASVSIRGGSTSGDPLADGASTNTVSRSASGITSTPPVSLNLSGTNNLLLWVYGDWNGCSTSYPSGFIDESNSTDCAEQPAIAGSTFKNAGSTGVISVPRSGNDAGMTAALLSFRSP